MKCTEAAGQVELANQIQHGGCGDFERYLAKTRTASILYNYGL